MNETQLACESIVDLLRMRARLEPERVAYTFLSSDGVAETLTYKELDRLSRSLGANLQELAEPGERALLLYPPGLHYLTAFFGCLYAGILAVPAYPPRANGNLTRLQAVAFDAQAKLALSTSQVLTGMENRMGEMPGLTWLATDEMEPGAEDRWQEPVLQLDALAFLQYTSGSTSAPKGVMVSHGNLLNNLQLIEQAFGTTRDGQGVVWLPPYHDMGLIGGILQPLFTGYPMTLMAPVDFITKPLRWLQAVSDTKATVSGGPNFAYDLCLNKITPEQRDQLDLSSWQLAFTGAEPIRAETLERFADYFAPSGFRKEAFYPCYGLAEGTLFVVGGPQKREPVVQSFAADSLEENEARLADDLEEARLLVGSGELASAEQQVLIVDPQELTELADGQIGEIWVAGPSVAQGYWQREEQSQETFCAQVNDRSEGTSFLRTGDLGFVRDGQLYVTGRMKDLIIIRGRNYYPQDIEFTVQESHPAVQSGNGAAFSVEVDGEERLVIVQEVERASRKGNLEEVISVVRRRIADEHQLQVHAVVLIRPASIPKTSSGKIQRHACRMQFLSGELKAVASWIAGQSERGDDAEEPELKTVQSRAELLAFPHEQRQAELVRTLAGLAAEVLKEAPAGVPVEVPVSMLGLDSLMAVELTHRVELAFGVRLSPEELLDGPSLVQTAEQMLSMFEEEQAEMRAERLTMEAPLSYGQEAMRFLEQFAPGNGAYTIAHAVRLPSRVDVVKLEQAFRWLAVKHPALRTVIAEDGGVSSQRVQQSASRLFTVEDASLLTEEAVQARMEQAARAPFDLTAGPLFRVHVFLREDGPLLVLSAHHILFDFWSFGVLVKELSEAYATLSAGGELPAVESDVEYLQLFDRQRALAEGNELDRLREYWKGQLAGCDGVLTLPTDRPRPPVQTYRGAEVRFTLSAELTQQVKQVAKAGQATLYMTLLSAFQTLLFRYTGQEDILVGSPWAGRNRARLTEAVGYFVNPIVLKASFADGMTFAELLQQVRKTVLGALKHAEYPFSLLVEELQPHRDLSYPPLYQVMFTLQAGAQAEGLGALAVNRDGVRFAVGELELEAKALELGAAQVDLSLVMAEVSGALSGSIAYNADLFEAETMERLVKHFETLLAAVVQDLEQEVLALELVPEAEQRELLSLGRGLETAREADLLLHELFERQAAKTPDATALLVGDGSWTYRQLEERANRIAGLLRARGAVSGEIVGLYTERTPQMVAALFGILKAGCAYLPLDPAYPLERLQYMVADAGAGVLLTEEKLKDLLNVPGTELLCLDDEAIFAAAFEKQTEAAAAETDLAYLIYTSGSTGQPKGVQIDHRGAVNFVLSMQETFALQAGDVMAAMTPVSFDISVLELYVPLCAGAAVALFGREETADGRVLARRLAETGAKFIQATPARWQQLLQAGWQADAGMTLLTGGEALPGELAVRLCADGAALWNLYGPTEATVWATMHKVDPQQSVQPIGRPIPNLQVVVLDKRGQLVPQGVYGELCIGGAGTGPGYLNRAEQTAAAFIDSPFGRLYKTGDLARFGLDGTLEYGGRIDQQVKVRGFRIELTEVEAVLEQHPHVQQAAAAVHDQSLVGYVLGTETDPTVLRSFLQQQLPDFMVPSVFLFLEQFPLTPSGKLDRKALPVPVRTVGRDYVPPRTETEAFVAELFAGLLKLERAGADDHFFEAGGHSLLAGQVMARVTSACGVELPLRALFEAPTVAGFAAKIEAAQAAGASEGAGQAGAKLAPVPRELPLPLSFAQQRLWFLDRLEPGNHAYHIPAAVRLQGQLDTAALERSFRALAARHEALRTTFDAVDGKPVQVIHAVSEVSLSVTDLTLFPEEHREGMVSGLIRDEVKRPFDLQQMPLLRLLLLRLSEAEHVLVLTMHHLISDGWSVGVLIREVTHLYEAERTGREPDLAELPVQFADYAVWQREWLDSEERYRDIEYWQHKLGGSLPVLQLPTDRPRPMIQTFNGATVHVTLDGETVERLRTLAVQEGATLYMTLVTAYKTLLFRYTGQEDLLVGTPVAGRGRTELEQLIGFFVNTLVLRTDLSGNPSFRELLQRVSQTALEAYEHGDVPFEKLIEVLQPERNMSHSLLFQTMFILQNAPLGELRLHDASLAMLEIEGTAAKFDLTLSMMETEAGMTASFEYNTDLFDRATIERLAGHFQILLQGITDDPGAPLSALPMLSSIELQRLLGEWNDTAADVEDDVCLHELLERQAQKTPHAEALVFEDKVLTFAELNERSNSLARALQKRGAGRGTLVGICMERSPEMITGLLAILKAGAAYLPLDPTYPQERLAYMLEDSGAGLLLTQERLRGRLPSAGADILTVDSGDARWTEERSDSLGRTAQAADLAYIIYTSGSTGKPKGVAVTHHNAVNFCAGMDERVGATEQDALLAVTSICFDISVLELFWTLTRGVKVVLLSEAEAAGGLGAQERKKTGNGLEFSLFYFASDEGGSSHDKYRTLVDGAKFADANGFTAVWTPERHFHQFGGLYPSPAVSASALAMVTENVQLRAGSVVLPLHSPIRVAEDWSVVDNFSQGRVALSFASGWHADDFVFAPENYAERTKLMFEGIETVQRLWRGDAVPFPGGAGQDVAVKILPRPVQAELPVFVTSGGNPETFKSAGAIGANLLTHLLGQSIEELGAKIRIYRESLAEHGYDPNSRKVALMLHTFVSDDMDEVRERVREPFTAYLRSSAGLMENLAKSLNLAKGLRDLTPSDMDDLLEHAFNRYFETSALFGTPESCLEMTARLREIGVDEAACLIDFGLDHEAVMKGLNHLNELRELCKPDGFEEEQQDFSLGAQAVRHGATILQCTPSLMKILAASGENVQRLQSLDKLLLGGEALAASHARELRQILPNTRLINMYGPTEATVWATTYEVQDDLTGAVVPIGTPFVNVTAYVLDAHLQPVPTGVPGELHIGGRGVAQGYLHRPELTAERFVPSPFVPEERLYKTGDLVRQRPDGVLEFLDRVDSQVKIRGFRIELGEIEEVLRRSPEVRETAVIVREDAPGDRFIAAYVVPESGGALSHAALKEHLQAHVPAYMVPSAFVTLEQMPLTLNGKIDRKALPDPRSQSSVSEKLFVAPQTEHEQKITSIWQEVLRVERVGLDDNFFELGGHSLQVVQVHSKLIELFERDITVGQLFQYPTVRALAKYFGEEENDKELLQQGKSRGNSRRETLQKRGQARSRARR